MKYLIAVKGKPAYYLARSAFSSTGYAWKRGPLGRQHAYRFTTREEAGHVMARGFGGAAGRTAEIIEVDK